jgi:hypothetical protein
MSAAITRGETFRDVSIIGIPVFLPERKRAFPAGDVESRSTAAGRWCKSPAEQAAGIYLLFLDKFRRRAATVSVTSERE